MQYLENIWAYDIFPGNSIIDFFVKNKFSNLIEKLDEKKSMMVASPICWAD